MSQLSHIIKGFLLLFCLVCCGYFIKILANTEIAVPIPEKNFFCGTVGPSSSSGYRGKSLFQQKCSSCHQMFKEGTGPALVNVFDRHKWADPKEFGRWVRDPSKYMKRDKYTQGLKAKYGSVMQAFPDITDDELDQIIAYINEMYSSTRY